jgi:hypothetical protein
METIAFTSYVPLGPLEHAEGLDRLYHPRSKVEDWTCPDDISMRTVNRKLTFPRRGTS